MFYLKLDKYVTWSDTLLMMINCKFKESDKKNKCCVKISFFAKSENMLADFPFVW